MPVEQLATPTISEIGRELAAYQEQYGITTEQFLAGEGVCEVDEDDANDWYYRVEQLRVLRQVQFVHPYAQVEKGTSLKNCDSKMDCLAA